MGSFPEALSNFRGMFEGMSDERFSDLTSAVGPGPRLRELLELAGQAGLVRDLDLGQAQAEYLRLTGADALTRCPFERRVSLWRVRRLRRVEGVGRGLARRI